MDKKSEGVSYTFTKGYKKLPVKNRAGMIRTARNLLKQQDEDMEMLAFALSLSVGERKGAK
ncbi:MAG: hypothetical protein FWB79_02780 [Treponema sp.]|nr:hypothetical protein [Treponema sp.]